MAEYVYLLEAPDFRPNKVDRIGDAVCIGDGRFYVIERDPSTIPQGKKYVFKVDLKGATNLLADGAPSLNGGLTLEQHSADDLAAFGIRPVNYDCPFPSQENDQAEPGIGRRGIGPRRRLSPSGARPSDAAVSTCGSCWALLVRQAKGRSGKNSVPFPGRRS